MTEKEKAIEDGTIELPTGPAEKKKPHRGRIVVITVAALALLAAGGIAWRTYEDRLMAEARADCAAESERLRVATTAYDALLNGKAASMAKTDVKSVKDAKTLAVRPAPIYDTGASLWSGELDVDGRDWFAKPFYTATGRPSALRQLRLVEDWSRFDLDALSDWPDEAAHELSRMRMFAPERLDAIRDQLAKRIGMIRRIRDDKSLRASGPIRNRADLLDRFGDTLRKNLARQDGDGKSAGIDYKGPRHHMGH